MRNETLFASFRKNRFELQVGFDILRIIWVSAHTSLKLYLPHLGKHVRITSEFRTLEDYLGLGPYI